MTKSKQELRIEIATAAMQGLLANPDQQTVAMTPKQIAVCAVEHADALLAKLFES